MVVGREVYNIKKLNEEKGIFDKRRSLFLHSPYLIFRNGLAHRLFVLTRLLGYPLLCLPFTALLE